MPFTLEGVLTSPKCFGLTKATPLQRALCRVADGLPFDNLVCEHPELLEQLEKTFGPGGLERLPGVMPKEFYLISGIRTAKSLICAAIAFRCAMTVDLAILQPWEEAVVSVVSITLKKARIIMRHLTGPLLARPNLRGLLVRDPTSGTVWLRRPQDGRIVRIEIAAGAKAGGSLVGDWSAGILFDEFTRMTGEEDGSIINFDESRNAVLGRILPGGMLAGVGSPWAPRGAAYEIVKTRWGSPSEDLVVARPPARAMNPHYWTDATIAKLRRSPKGEHVYKTDFLGEFADPESNFFTTPELEAVTRKGAWVPVPDSENGETLWDPRLVLPARDDCQHFAAIDPAMLRNAWTLVIGRREYRPDGSPRVVIVLCKQWVPARIGPLNPEIIIPEIKLLCEPYRVTEVYTDRWKSDELEKIGTKNGLSITVFGIANQDFVNLCDSLRLRVLTGAIEFPDDPEVRTDLLAIRRIARNRTMAMDLPFSTDGRHCDYVPALVVVNALAAAGVSWMEAMDVLERRGGRLG